MAAILATTFVIPFGFIIATEVAIGRDISTTVLVDQLPTTGNVNLLVIVIVVVPSLVVTIFSTASIQRLIVKKNTVAPAEVGIVEQQEAAQKKKRAKAAIRLIIAVSGSFWMTYFPASIIRITLTRLGYSWYDLDTRKSQMASLLARFSMFLGANVSSVLNPFLICYTHPEIRAIILQFRDRWLT